MSGFEPPCESWSEERIQWQVVTPALREGHMTSRERYAAQREADYQAKLDVEYEVWRSGGDPDAVDRDMVQGELDQGYSFDEIASIELQSQRGHAPEPNGESPLQ